MSRSRKKNPFHWLCASDYGRMKRWKKEANAKIRRVKDEIPSGAKYKRFGLNMWNSPSDGKCDGRVFFGEKAFRK